MGTIETNPFQYLNDEVIQQFDGAGSESLAQALETRNSSEVSSESITSQIFTELLLVYNEGKITIENVVKFLELAIKDEVTAEIFCQILDVLPVTLEIQQLLLKLYQNQNIVKQSTMARMISLDVISKLKLVPADSLNKQLNIHKRDVFYTQKKYNLIHEESEGYAKLVVEIYAVMTEGDSAHKSDYALQVIEKLIGHYNLDPNRCLDVLIEIFSNNFVGNQDFVIQLLKKSPWWPSVESDSKTNFTNLSTGGNQSAAKIIGLRLVKHPSDRDLPETLKIFVACLIKEGFLSFSSIYPYFKSDDDALKLLKEEYEKDLQEKIFKASASALALAAPLAEEDEDMESGENSSNKQSSQSKPSQDENQKPLSKLSLNLTYQFLRVLLGNGLYWPSIYILTEHPFLAHVNEEIGELINRLFNEMLEPLYDSIKVFSNEELNILLSSKKIAFSRPFNNIHYEEFPCTKLLSFKPTAKSHSLKQFQYFYDNWNKDIPLITTVEELFKISKEFLKFSGVNLAKDPELFTKLCEIGNWDLNNADDKTRKNEWHAYFRNFLFVAMPLIEDNSIVIEKAFLIMKHFSSEERFNLYGEMHQVFSKNNPYLKIAYGKAEKATKDVLKRLSKENVKPMMRRLAKISFANPLPCFLTILQQIESYDNLNSLVVETARYFNSYGWDALTLAILMRLTSGRSNLQDDGLNDRQWIQSLSSFIGKICHRYPNAIDLKTLLTFFLKSLHSRDNSALIVLREILSSMGGIQTISNLTSKQIDMINSGNSLRKIVYNTIEDTRFDRYKSGSILVKTLIELDAVNELFVLFCQLKHESLLDPEGTDHLKILANRNDELNNIIHLFTNLVSFFGDHDVLSQLLVSPHDFIRDYKISAEWAFEVWRPFLSNETKGGSQHESVEMKLDQIIKESDGVLSKDLWGNLSPSLYLSFWRMSLYDINFSSELYESELKKLESRIVSLGGNNSLRRKGNESTRHLTDIRKQELRLLEKFVEEFPKDEKKHSQHSEKVLLLMKDSTKEFFKNDIDVNVQARYFLQYCVLPRAKHSPFDAAFAAKFLFLLHEMKVENFDLFIHLDVLIDTNILFGTLFTLTSSESEHFGIFFAEIFKNLSEWSKVPSGTSDDKVQPEVKIENLSEFKKRLYGYHCITLANLKDSLQIDEYMSRRNSITFLKFLVGVYPIVEEHCEQIVFSLENIFINDEREDLKLSSNALIGHVKSRAKFWVPLWEFIDMEEEEIEDCMEKRRKVKEEAKLKAIEAKQAIEREQLKRRLNSEKEAQELKLSSAKFSYDDLTTSRSRPNARGYDSSRTRYDYYSKYGEKTTAAPEKSRLNTDQNKEVNAEATIPEFKAQGENKDDSLIKENSIQKEEDNDVKDNGNEENGTPKPVSSEPDKSDNVEKSDEKAEKPKVDLKARIREAKRELKESAGADKVVDEKDSDNAPTKPNARRPQALPPQHNVKEQEDKKFKQRTPLPPQNFAARNEISNDARFGLERDQKGTGKRYSENFGNRHNQRPFSSNSANKSLNKNVLPPPSTPPAARSSSRPIPPPPLPPPTVPKQTERAARGNDSYNSRNTSRFEKRRHDGYGSNNRNYDKRPRNS